MFVAITVMLMRGCDGEPLCLQTFREIVVHGNMITRKVWRHKALMCPQTFRVMVVHGNTITRNVWRHKAVMFLQTFRVVVVHGNTTTRNVWRHIKPLCFSKVSGDSAWKYDHPQLLETSTQHHIPEQPNHKCQYSQSPNKDSMLCRNVGIQVAITRNSTTSCRCERLSK